MDTRKIPALAGVLVLLLATAATAGIPHGPSSMANADNCGRFTVAPGGGENLVDPPYNNDYMITLVVLDINGDPVVGLPATDMYVWHDELATCPGVFSQADGPTDASGTATFSGTIYAGLVGDASDGVDCDWAVLYVYALGMIMNDSNPVCVATDSSDLNGDLSVGIVDFAKYATDFNCVPPDCDPCHDYDYDGDNDITDFAMFGAYFNDSVCP